MKISTAGWKDPTSSPFLYSALYWALREVKKEGEDLFYAGGAKIWEIYVVLSRIPRAKGRKVRR